LLVADCIDLFFTAQDFLRAILAARFSIFDDVI